MTDDTWNALVRCQAALRDAERELALWKDCAQTAENARLALAVEVERLNKGGAVLAEEVERTNNEYVALEARAERLEAALRDAERPCLSCDSTLAACYGAIYVRRKIKCCPDCNHLALAAAPPPEAPA